MTPAAHLSAAIEILQLIGERRRPAQDVLKEWGVGHRFAGSKDRAAIASLVFDALRKRASAAFVMGDESPRAILLGALREARGMGLASVAPLFSGEGHAPAPLTEEERARYEGVTLADAPAQVRGDYPQWLASQLEAALGEAAAAEGAALAERAPVDLRVNILKATREEAQKKSRILTPSRRLSRRSDCASGPAPTGAGRRSRPSQLSSRASSRRRTRVRSWRRCFAARRPASRFSTFARAAAARHWRSPVKRTTAARSTPMTPTAAGSRRSSRGWSAPARAMFRSARRRAGPTCSRISRGVAISCSSTRPCTGTGTWRRHPDAKWRLAPGAIDQRLKEQSALLGDATRYVKPGGRLAYVTCSLLCEENEKQIEAFLAAHPNFKALSAEEIAARAHLPELARFASPHGFGLRFSPLSSGTDGFFVALVQRND